MQIMMDYKLYAKYSGILDRRTTEKLMYLFRMNELITKHISQERECSCCFESFFGEEEANYKHGSFDEYLSLLFMSQMIDQSLFYILADSRLNPACLSEPEVYNKYNENFKFIKIWYHLSTWYVSPVFVLKKFRPPNPDGLLIDKKKIKTAKELLWDNGVKQYLAAKGRMDVAELCEMEFRRDITLRHRYTEKDETQLKYIFE